MVQPIDRSIPSEIRPQIMQLETEAYVHLRMGRYSQCENLYRDLLGFLYKKQVEHDRAIHKGAPLHMIGLSLLYQEKLEDSVRFFLLAYIEDTLNVSFGNEAEADTAPASRVLRDLFQINIGFLDTVKQFSKNLKEQGKWQAARDPEKILEIVAKRENIDPKNLLALCKTRPKPFKKQPIDPLSGTWEKRVFIGGSYDQLAILREIQEIVIRTHTFQPILPYEFEVPQDKIHHHDLMLLHCCRLAIFEVSTGNGHLMEIERAKDYDVEVLLVYSSRNGPTHSMSSMLQTAGYPLEPYTDLNDLTKKVTSWLSKHT
jgi:hypothetical protein